MSLVLSGLMLGTVAHPSPAFAQGAPPAAKPPATTAAAPAAPPSKEQLAEAKKFFDAGNKLYKEGLYQEALASFVEANRISPRESIQRNIGQTYRDMKDLASAYDAYELLLAKYGDKMKLALKSDAQHAIEELAVLTGVIAINVTDADAHVTIDKKDAGTTPLAKPVRANIGTHTVEISKPGFETISQQVEIRGHDTIQVNGPLQKEILTGHVNVTVTPPDAVVKIFLDGKEVGPPPWSADIEPGIHTIEARGDTMVAAPKQIEVTKKGKIDEALEVHVQQGIIAVNVDVADSEISVDGKVVAKGVFEGPEPIGPHSLVVKHVGFTDYQKDLIVHDGERTVENVALQRAQAAVVAPPPDDGKGLYAQLLFLGAFETTTPSNDIAKGVGYNTDTGINGSSIFGGGLNVRIGYSFGVLGIEGSILGRYDHSQIDAAVSTSTQEHPGATPRTEDWEFHRIGGNLSVGLRLMPQTQIVRPTFGIAGGFSMNGMFFNRSIQGTQSAMPSDPAFYVAPSLMMDLGIELGSTPGTRFYLGGLLLAEFAGATAGKPSTSFNDPNYPVPASPINVVNGKDVFIGPILGMQFGE
jgi:hypothetical protein